MWVRFMDMHSGGRQKIAGAPCVYIEADSEAEGIEIFQKRFDRSPDNVTCECCGEDYSISTHDSLEQASAYDRHCAWVDGRYVERPSGYFSEVIPLDDYLKTVIVLRNQTPDVKDVLDRFVLATKLIVLAWVDGLDDMTKRVGFLEL